MGRKICYSNPRGESVFLIFSQTKLDGAYIIELEKLEDERGFFARSWDEKKFDEMKLNAKLVQCNISFNKKKGTIRGMHYQAKPHEEAKVVRCCNGSIFDVIIDLRPNSKTYRKWISIELTDKNYKMIYVPEGFAHGFQTLEDNTEVVYQMSEYFEENYARGIRYDDPIFQIPWPIIPPIISKKDLSYNFLKET